MNEREELKQMSLADLRREIAAGIDEADRGKFVDGPAAFAKIRERSALRKKLAEDESVRPQ